ncbi:MAG: hypothetical protein M1829_000302 [Trizodia sp. TS-e1964]|nr:MAG: hypothetical protein M1829_000302 [Trizodia sp. TS-e1964]
MDSLISCTLESLPEILKHDTKIKVGGIDVDGVLRGKLMSKNKFLSVANEGFGFCSIIFGWDIEDRPYFKELKVSNKKNGFRDMVAVPDLKSFRRIPWEGHIPLFLLSFYDPGDMSRIIACPRGLLATVNKEISDGMKAMAGIEYEFVQYKAPRENGPRAEINERNSSSTAKFLQENDLNSLQPITADKKGDNVFARREKDTKAEWADIAHISEEGRQFLAGLLDGLPDIMPLLAPTVNSYKRLVENFWAPVTVSWGLEHRAASIRIIAPPTSSPKATRFEIRVPGADANPHLALAAILALGLRGMRKEMDISLPPLGKGEDVGGSADRGIRLARSLKEATQQFMRKDSIAREVFGDDFVDHFGGTREHEVKLWDEAVTDWEIKRYVESI